MPSEPAHNASEGTLCRVFLPVPVSGRVAKGHNEIVKRYQVPIDGSEVLCHDEIVSVKSKKQGTRASDDSANDAVPGDETVRIP